jgi:hypothetical protein
MIHLPGPGGNRGPAATAHFPAQVGARPADQDCEPTVKPERMDMEDYRHRPRKNTPHLVKAIDLANGMAMGRIVDITADGMMLVTQTQPVKGQIYNFRINLPVMVHHRTDVSVEAKCVWWTEDDNGRFYKAGFQFKNLPGEDGFLLEDVMHKLNLVG